MAVRFVALLIPLAITLPQLQMSRPAVSAAERQAAAVTAAPAPEWLYEPRQSADAPSTRVVLEAPVQEAVRAMEPPAVDTALAAVVPSGAPKASLQRTASRPATAAVPAKRVVAVKASLRSGARKDRPAPLLQGGCEPFVHCAPVEVAKITPVSRQPL
jgi:hypothetical protein